jgi:hypothetical protein
MNRVGVTVVRTAIIVVVIALVGFAAWLVNHSTSAATGAQSAAAKAADGNGPGHGVAVPSTSPTSSSQVRNGSSPSATASASTSVVARAAPSVRPSSSAASQRSTGQPAGNSAGQSCTKPVWSSSEKQGKWDAPDDLYVNNNMWNSEAGPQTIYVCSANNFYAVSNQPNLASDPGSVKTYPSVARNFDDPTISSFHTITSTFGESIPAEGNWDAAYDIWTDDWNNEIMIWNQERNQGQVPPSGSVSATIDGQGFHAWRDGTYVGIYMNTFESSGSVNILDVFKWLESEGWMKASDTLTAVGYGVEISVTPGPETFQITNFSLTTN